MRVFFRIFGLFFFLLMGLLFFPNLISTPLGKKIFIRIVEKKMDGAIEIGSMHLSWFGFKVKKQMAHGAN